MGDYIRSYPRALSRARQAVSSAPSRHATISIMNEMPNLIALNVFRDWLTGAEQFVHTKKDLVTTCRTVDRDNHDSSVGVQGDGIGSVVMDKSR